MTVRSRLIAPDRLAQAKAITACGQVGQTDLTYLPTRAGCLYLVLVIATHRKRVFGWAFRALAPNRLCRKRRF